MGFDTPIDIQVEVEKIIKEDEEKTGGIGKPATYSPQANILRLASSRQVVNSFREVGCCNTGGYKLDSNSCCIDTIAGTEDIFMA